MIRFKKHTPSVPYIEQATAPASEPLTLTETKEFLRVETSGDDDMITRMIAVARIAAEQYLRRSLITQSWKVSFDDYAPQEVNLPRGTIQSITSAKLIARDGTETLISASNYYLSARRKLVFDIAPMSHRVEIVYSAGYGDASTVPENIKQGMLSHVSRMYDERSANVPIVKSAITLYEPYRIINL